MADSDSLTLSLSCAICLDIASTNNAVETSCCHQLFCLTCIENVQPCPACRKEGYVTIPAYFARRLIGNLTVSCPNEGCMEKITRSNLETHVTLQCDFIKVTCPDLQCQNFKCSKKHFIDHLTKKHEKFLLDNFDKLWQNEKTIGKGTIVGPVINSPIRVEASSASSIFDDRLEETRNKFGRYARLGSNGKFYCGGKLDGPRCFCCNGACGPTNGCNCSACMLLDVQKRKLPRGWLVNSEGASARFSQEEPTKLYCGRRVLINNPRTDGYCGPTNGEQCNSCVTLTQQQRQRYREIWND